MLLNLNDEKNGVKTSSLYVLINQAADLHHCELGIQVQMYIYWTPTSLSP